MVLFLNQIIQDLQKITQLAYTVRVQSGERKSHAVFAWLFFMQSRMSFHKNSLFRILKPIFRVDNLILSAHPWAGTVAVAYPKNDLYKSGTVRNDHLTKIITQKYLAQLPYLPLETWSDHR